MMGSWLYHVYEELYSIYISAIPNFPISIKSTLSTTPLLNLVPSKP